MESEKAKWQETEKIKTFEKRENIEKMGSRLELLLPL